MLALRIKYFARVIISPVFDAKFTIFGPPLGLQVSGAHTEVQG